MADADILVGVPVYKDGLMVQRCLASLEEPGVQLLIVDNGSDPDVKQVLPGKGVIIRNAQNRYVNPAWNQVMEFFLAHRGRYKVLVLANSDLILDAGWAAKLREHLQAGSDAQIIFGVDAQRTRSSLGSFFAMTPEVVRASWPIPDDFLIFGGDDFIFHVNFGLRRSQHVLGSLTMFHVERGTYDKSPEIWEIGRRDTDRWNAYGPDLAERRVNEVIERDRS